MKTIDNNQTHPQIPLSEKDTKALDEMFEQLEVEAIEQIEASAARSTVVPPEPWEEKGWVINSFVPKRD
ncbi:MAG: hypothetical protein LDL41_14350 [Coleofasciculus sp. S288]|nr:hypothetical protein [Coleofasciculus sp. S288]